MSVWTIDPDGLKHVCPNLSDQQATVIARGLGEAFHRFGIDNEQRAAMAVAQWAEESDHFRVSEEYASGSAYEGRRDLGNVQRGDGVRFKGRGRIMITGRTNYAAMATALEVDCILHPELLAQSPHSELASGQWWQDNGCNDYCDRGDFKGLTKRINGGLNGFDERCRLHTLAQQVAPRLVPKDMWAVLTDDEREQMDVLTSERRSAQRHGGWDKLNGSHVQNASKAKHWLMDRCGELERLATAEPNGWAKANRRRRYELMKSVTTD
jgi:putative chitinase